MTIYPALAAALRDLGPTLDLSAVHALYELSLLQQPRDGVTVYADEPYGPAPRQRLDVYTPAQRRGQPVPVLVWMHGGGFVRGDKQQRANIGYWGARAGLVTVLPNYRLAPAHRWPSGAEDVVAVWQWLTAHTLRFGGDAERIVLAGESAGAAHVAAATLMRRFQPANWRVAGAALLSGPYNARLEGLARVQFGIATPDPRNEAYFGPERSAWDAASIVDHVDAAPFPLWIGFAERDLVQMHVQAGELFARLVSRHGFAPELRMLREHNHFSSGYSIGTEDTSVSQALLDFIRSCS
jgi:acetyl esterase